MKTKEKARRREGARGPVVSTAARRDPGGGDTVGPAQGLAGQGCGR